MTVRSDTWHTRLACKRAALILKEVSDKHGVPVNILSNKTRVRPAVLARWEAMYRLYQEGMTTTEIGFVLERHSSDVSHGLTQFVRSMS
jgi:hypothetical protein